MPRNSTALALGLLVLMPCLALGQAGPCARADLLAEIDPDRAEEAYLELDPADGCVLLGLERLERLRFDARLRSGDRYAAAGQPDKAIEAYEEALSFATDEGARTVAERLARVRAARVAERLDRAAEHEKAERYDEAASQYRAALEIAPESAAASEGLARVTGKLTARTLQRHSAVGDYAGATAALLETERVSFDDIAASQGLGLTLYWLRGKLVALLELTVIAFAGLLLLGFLVMFARRYLTERVLLIETFMEDSLGHKFGTGVAFALQSELARIVEGGGESLASVRVEAPIQTELSIPTEVIGALPGGVRWVESLPALLGRAVSRRTARVSGALHYSEGFGAGLSLRLVEGSKITGSQVLWQYQAKRGAGSKDKLDETPFLELATYAAAWLIFHLKSRKGRFKLLGTEDWRAYVSFQRGVNAERHGDRKLARSSYVQALRFDNDMQCARYNLALMAEPRHHRLTFQSLAIAADRSSPDDATRYKARYTHALRLHRAGRLEEACKVATTLAEEIDNVLSSKPKRGLRGKRRPDQALVSFLRHARAFALPMKIGLDVEVHHDHRRMAEIEQMFEEASTGHRAFQIACVYAAAARSAGVLGSRAKRAGERKRLESERMHYLERCLTALETAIYLSPELAEELERDPSLDDVRTSSERLDGVAVSERFAAIGPSAPPPVLPPPPALPLAALSTIGGDHARALAAAGIADADALVKRARTRGEREALAGALGVSEQRVLRWAQTAELLNIVGIDFETANLLNACGVFSPADLAAADANALHTEMDAWNMELRVARVPAAPELLEWIADARALPRKVAA